MLVADLEQYTCGHQAMAAQSAVWAQVLSTQQHDGPLADVWSLGVCLNVLLTGAFPVRLPPHHPSHPCVLLKARPLHAWQQCHCCQAVLEHGALPDA
jgi:hypothetical protein